MKYPLCAQILGIENRIFSLEPLNFCQNITQRFLPGRLVIQRILDSVRLCLKSHLQLKLVSKMSPNQCNTQGDRYCDVSISILGLTQAQIESVMPVVDAQHMDILLYCPPSLSVSIDFLKLKPLLMQFSLP